MTTSVGSSGGIDVATIVQQLVSADRGPSDARFDRTDRQLQAQISAVGMLRGAFSALRTAVNALSAPEAAQARSVTLADGSGFTATASAGASVGRYQVEVLAIASAHKLRSSAFASSVAAVGTGTLTLTTGATTLSVDIDATNNSLSGIRDAINAKAGGKSVVASILVGDDGAHLVLGALNSGAGNALRVTTTGGDGGLAALVYDPPTTTALAELNPATDARVKVDGVERSGATNTFADIIPGVSLKLSLAAPGVVHDLTIARDPAVQRNAAKNFISAYNASIAAIATTSAYNTSTRVAAALNGDSLVRGASRDLRDIVGANVSDLKTLGITIGKDGTLALNESTFDAGAAADPAAAQRLFGPGSSTLAGKLDSELDHLLDSDGLLTARSSGLNARTQALAKQRAALDDRMAQVAERYRAQFTALNDMVGKLQSTSTFLSQQLAKL